MKVVGIVAEYNPFHNGHRYLIDEIRRRFGPDTAIVAAMSGNWVQRGDCAIAEKHLRAGTALQGGANLVLEIPLTWSMASAERFAKGGTGILRASGIVDFIAFGSESGDPSALSAYAEWIDTEEYRRELHNALDQGVPYAAARQMAIRTRFPEFPDSDRTPNDQLGIEYIRALKGSGIGAIAIPRIAVGHHDDVKNGFASATALREKILAKEDISAYIPYSPFIENAASLKNCDRAILAVLRQQKPSYFMAIPDCTEGLENRIMNEIASRCSFDELCADIKTKRYAYSRIRRILLRAYLGINRDSVQPELPYLRILAADSKGRDLLREMRSKASLPVLTKPAAVRKIGENALKQFELESRASDLWQLCREIPGPCGIEWKTDPIMTGL